MLLWAEIFGVLDPDLGHPECCELGNLPESLQKSNAAIDSLSYFQVPLRNNEY